MKLIAKTASNPDLPGDPFLGPAQRLMHAVGQSGALQPARQALVTPLRLSWSTSRPILVQREDLPLLLNRRGLLGCGVEIGVRRGEFSEKILGSWKGRHLIAVDPWMQQESYDDLANVEQGIQDGLYEETLERLSRFGSRGSVWRMCGKEAASRIPHHTLDFVYIDARHDYESVLEDLSLWFEKVRPGGLICGHDYVDGHFDSGDFGVKRAVDEFFGGRGTPVSSTFADSPWHSWFVIAR